MRITIVGGHLSPALAVIENLPKDTEVLFIGRKYVFEGDKTLSLEYRTINKQKIPFAEISTGRWQRKFTRFTIASLFKIPYGFIQSFIILRKFKPDVFLGFGGYLSLPLGLAAFILRIPIVIHEQTLEAGITNRILSIFAKKICISWETSFKYFPKDKTVFTGNPIRKFSLSSRLKWRDLSQQTLLKEIPRQARNDTPVIYITGGSSGSHFINTLVEGCIRQLLEKFNVFHQTGDAQKYHDFDRLQNFRESLPFALKARYAITKFVEPENIGSVIKVADLVVSRAGINTITELIFFKKPSLLIPIPFSQRNEQVKNALFLKSLGLAEVFYQDALDSKKFLRFIEEMFNNKSRYKILNRSMKQVQDMVQDDKKSAAKKIIEVLEYAKKNNKKPE